MSMPAPEEIAALFNKVYDEALARGLSMTEANDRAHAAVLQALDARSEEPRS